MFNLPTSSILTHKVQKSKRDPADCGGYPNKQELVDSPHGCNNHPLQEEFVKESDVDELDFLS
jgi:hypothetical protein